MDKQRFSLNTADRQHGLTNKSGPAFRWRSIGAYSGPLSNLRFVPVVGDCVSARPPFCCYALSCFCGLLATASRSPSGNWSMSSTSQFYRREGAITFSNKEKGLTSVESGQLFDRFYTVESGRSSTEHGLSIAKILTEKCGDQITAKYHKERLCIKVQL